MDFMNTALRPVENVVSTPREVHPIKGLDVHLSHDGFSLLNL